MLTSGEIISETVENLIADAISETRRNQRGGKSNVRQLYTEMLNELADFLGVTHTYMPRKMKEGIWSSRDLDRLAVYFDKYPGEFLPDETDGHWGIDMKSPRASTTETEGTHATASAQKDPDVD